MGDFAQARVDRSEVVRAGLVVAVALATFFTLWLFRAHDDNRLVSWSWAFADTGAVELLSLLVLALAAAVLLSRRQPAVRATPIMLFVLAWLAALLFWSAPEPIVDSARYFTQAKHLALHGPTYFATQWGREIAAWTDLPLIPFLYGVTLSLFGEQRLYLQAFTTLLFAATVVLTYLIGRALWHERLGWHGALLLLAMPYLLTQVPLTLVDVPTMFFVTAAVYALIQAFARAGAWIPAAAVLVAAAALTKYSVWPMLVAALVAILLGQRWQPAVVVRAGAVIVAAGLALGIYIVAAQDVVAAQLALLHDYQAPGLGRWRESLASTFLFQIHPFVTVAALLSVLVAWRRRDPRYAVLGAPWLVMLVFASGRIRYLVPLFPLLALMAAYGLELLRHARLERLVVWCAVTTSVAIAAFGYLPFLRQTSAANLENAGAFLDRLEDKTVEVFVLPQTGAAINPAVSVPLLDLYTRKRLVYRETGAPPPPGVATSPLRFTWEAPPPRYYAAPAGAAPEAAVVVISSARGQPLPPPVAARLNGASALASFDRADGVYGYQTLVAVYRRAEYPNN
ncbi:MAG: glycosyltransferase family 39 protein [Gammaproteobacteria bacterium]|nr:glycosyltransferase family 39 protein [Gammaproteobacteria bacterium]